MKRMLAYNLTSLLRQVVWKTSAVKHSFMAVQYMPYGQA